MKMKISICLVLIGFLMPVLLPPLMERNYGRHPLPTTPAAPVTVLQMLKLLTKFKRCTKYFWEYAEPTQVS
jgi:hypothetical protein